VLLLAIPVGALIGLSLGALGGGGSILTVPALVYLLNQSTHGATTASLIIVGITALVGAVAHLRAGRVRVRSGVSFGVLGAGGSYAGSRLSASVDPNVLLLAFSVLIIGVAVTMLRRHDRGRRAPIGPPTDAAVGAATVALTTSAGTSGGSRAGVEVETAAGRQMPAIRVSPLRVVAAATVVGLLTGFFGVGGGFVVVPALVLALGFDMAAAVGTSLLVIAINSASALLSRLGTHAQIHVAMLVAFTAAAIAGTLVGSRVASKTTPERLVGALALLLIAVGGYTGARSVAHLV
jgi:hypothetical protein